MSIPTLRPDRRRQERAFARALERSTGAPPRQGRGGPLDDDVEALAALARSLRPAPVRAAEPFRVALRERLLAEPVAARAVTPARPGRAARPVGTARRGPRLRRWVAGALGVGLLAAGGTALASTSALPGDPLYGVKRGIEDVRLSLSSGDAARGTALLSEASTRLREAGRLAADQGVTRPAAVARLDATLRDFDSEAAQGSSLLLAAYDRTHDPRLLGLLGAFHDDAVERLGDLRATLPPSVAAAVAGELDRALAEVDGIGRAVRLRDAACGGCATPSGTGQPGPSGLVGGGGGGPSAGIPTLPPVLGGTPAGLGSPVAPAPGTVVPGGPVPRLTPPVRVSAGGGGVGATVAPPALPSVGVSVGTGGASLGVGLPSGPDATVVVGPTPTVKVCLPLVRTC